MNTTPNGKIGRLPEAIQETLNRRLQNGEKGRLLVTWLNSLPEVQAVLASKFKDGKPLREQNLSEWRKRGYQRWLWHTEMKEIAMRMAERKLARSNGANNPSRAGL